MRLIGTNKKIKDSIVVALLAGLAGSIAMETSNFLLWRKGKSEHLYGHLAGSMTMRASRTNQRKNFILGEIFHLITGSSLGLIQLEVFKKYGKDHHLVKGGSTGLITWGVLYNFGQRMGFFSRRTHLTKTKYASLWNHLVYGIVTSQVIVKIADPSIFKQNKDNELASTNLAQSDNSTYPRFDSSTQSEVTEIIQH